MKISVNTDLLKEFKPEEVILIEWLIEEFLQLAKDYYKAGEFTEKNEILLWTSNVILKSPFEAVKTELILKNLEKGKHITRGQDLFEFCLDFESETLKQHFKNRLKEIGIE